MSHPGNVIGYHGIVDKRRCRNKWMVVPTTGFGLVALELVIACTDYWFWYGCSKTMMNYVARGL